jgi:hypothetical protein
MGGKRERKNILIVSLKAKALAHRLSPEQVATFEQMYRSAKSQVEQDEVTRALDFQMNGWKTGTDAYSRILQAESDLDQLGDDDDSPSMKAALARSQVSFRH